MNFESLKSKKNQENDFKALLDKYKITFDDTQPAEEKIKLSNNASNETENLLSSIMKDLEMAETHLESTSGFFNMSKDLSSLLQDLKSAERKYDDNLNDQDLVNPQSVLKDGQNTKSPDRDTLNYNEKKETSDTTNKKQKSLNKSLYQTEVEPSTHSLKNDDNADKAYTNNENRTEISTVSGPTEENNGIKSKKGSDNNKSTTIQPDLNNQLDVIIQSNTDSEDESSTDELNIPIPTSNPYVNFVQDFRAKYKGEQVTPTVMATLAAKKWRSLQDKERQSYINIGKNKCGSNQTVEGIKNYIRWMDISVED